jgi:hypothetical protein
MQRIRSTHTLLLLVFALALGTLAIFGTGCSGDDPLSPTPTAMDDLSTTKGMIDFGPGGVQVRPEFAVNPIDFGDGLIATTTKTQDGLRTVLKNANGQVIARSGYSLSQRAGRFVVPGVSEIILEDFDAPTANTYGANVSLYYFYKNVERAEGVASGRLDKSVLNEPGCDFIPDFLETKCMRACCDTHDACYELFGCTMNSWKPDDDEGILCNLCNTVVLGCMYNCIPPWIRSIWETEVVPLDDRD